MNTVVTIAGWLFLIGLALSLILAIYTEVEMFLTKVYNYARLNKFSLHDFINRSTARELRHANDLISKRLTELEN